MRPEGYLVQKFASSDLAEGERMRMSPWMMPDPLREATMSAVLGPITSCILAKSTRTAILCIITLDTSHPSKVNSRLPPHNHAKTKDSMESAPQGFRSNIEPERIRNLAKKKGGMTHGFCQKRLTILRKDRRYEE